MFDRNVGSVLDVINEKLSLIKRNAEGDRGKTDLLAELSQMQITMTAIRQAVEHLDRAANREKEA